MTFDDMELDYSNRTSLRDMHLALLLVRVVKTPWDWGSEDLDSGKSLSTQ